MEHKSKTVALIELVTALVVLFSVWRQTRNRGDVPVRQTVLWHIAEGARRIERGARHVAGAAEREYRKGVA